MSATDVPADVRRMVQERAAARTRADYARADELRDRIRAAGFDVVDGPGGTVVRPTTVARATGPTLRVVADPDEVTSVLGEPPTHDVGVQWIVEGWPADVVRGLESVRKHASGLSVHHVVVDASGEEIEWPADVEVVRVAGGLGWAAARNAGLRRAAGRVVVVIDGSVEARGDVLTPLVRALEDPTLGITGPFGIVSSDLRQFDESDGPDVDAIEAYLMAFRRDLIERGVRFDPTFRFYRMADVDLSFRVKAMGLRAVVTPVPVARHEHRVWANTPIEERERLSKRNFYRFLDRWRDRTDLLVARRDQ